MSQEQVQDQKQTSEKKKIDYHNFPSSYDYEVQINAPPRRTFWGTVKEDPVPVVGATVTAFILSSGLYAMLAGNSLLAQKMMRYRVVAQGSTVIIGGGTVAYTQWRATKKAHEVRDSE